MAHAQRGGLCGANRCFSPVCARKNRCALLPSPALLGASARAGVLAGFGILGVGYAVPLSPRAMQPYMRSSSNLLLNRTRGKHRTLCHARAAARRLARR